MLLFFEFQYCSDLLLLFRIYLLRVNLVCFGIYTLFLPLLYSFGTHAQRANRLIFYAFYALRATLLRCFLGSTRSAPPYCFPVGIYAFQLPCFFFGNFALCATLLLFFGFTHSAPPYYFLLGFMRSALPYCCLLGFMRSALPFCFSFWDLCAARYPTVFLCSFAIYALRATLLCSCVPFGLNALCATLLRSFGIYKLSSTLPFAFGVNALRGTLSFSFPNYALSATLLFEPFPSRNPSSEFRVLMFWAHN